MKWINGLTAEEKDKRRHEWNDWFAWYPVMVGVTAEQRKIKVWWQSVQRKGRVVRFFDGFYWEWEYREKSIGAKDLK
jgi:hypothetical protein